MARQVINTGSALADRTGDNGRVAFTKVNENFAELYTNHTITAAETAAGLTANDLNHGYPPGDIRRYGTNTTPGTTDMTAAIDSCLAANGFCVLQRETYLHTGIELESGYAIIGGGHSTVLKLANGADVPSISFSATDLDAVNVQLRDFAIDGNKANQTSADSHGVYLTNVDGTSGLLASHRISGIYIYNTKGDGMRLGFAMRRSRVEDIFIYHCDGYGLYLAAHSDSLLKGFDIGQSGLYGVFVNGAGTITLADFKIWFSGRLGDGAGGTGGTNGHGLVVRNTSIFIADNILTQENEGHGMRLYGEGSNMVGPVVTGFVSDSDNKEGDNVAAATSWSAISLDNIEHARIQASVRRFTNAQGTVQYALNTSDVIDSVIDLDIDPDAVLSFFVPNTIPDDNDIRINRSDNGFVTRGNEAATLILGQTSRTQVWSTPLTADRAIALDATHAWKGGKFHIVRTAAATGAFNLNVGTGPLKALGIGEWCDVEFDGSAWILTAYGAL